MTLAAHTAESLILSVHQSQGALPSLHQMMQQLVQANSVSSVDPLHDQSNKSVIELLAQWAQDIGMETQIQEVAPGKFNLIAQLQPDPLTNFITGTAQANDIKGLMFAGHTDTVGYLASQWLSDPFELQIVDGQWHGLGVCDMKGFFPLALTAIAQTLQENPQKKLAAPITLIATCDEETTMAGAHALRYHQTLTPHHIIIGEPSDGQAIYAHKGVLTTKLVLSGIRGHASDPGLGANAIEAAHWVIGQILAWRHELERHQDQHFKIPHPTLNFGCIHGGTNANVICDECEIILDMRLLPNMDVHTVETELAQRLTGLADAVPNTSLTITREDFSSAFKVEKTAGFVQMLEQRLQQPAQTTSFVTEAPLLQELGHTPIIFGPGNIQWAHKPNERLPLNTLFPMIQHLKYCLQQLFTA